ncbi:MULTISPECIES: NAD-dependent epimerase/dehydratase family protein [Parabacteroides]|jgi:dTDP-glucose 4,6-dehydratase|nr:MULTISPECIES: NAD(P)-dependent oxidoreductase [Parabacteroides]MCM0715565.1 NAD(P)-dependent oxidoreductase [Parabacteroides sp. TA-V-105]
MRILVTGSKGIVGLKLVSELEKKGHSVFGVDILHHPGEIGYVQVMSHEPWKYSRCDIGEYRQIERIFDMAGPFDLVYNCAAEFGRWNGEDYYEQMWKSNLIGLKNIIRLQEKHHFKLIHFSSSEVYGDYMDIMHEDVMDKHVIYQMNDYAISKRANEMQIRNSRIMYGTETVLVRLFNTYGPGEYYHPYRSVNCKFCYHALFGLPVQVFQGFYRSSTYIDDCVRTLANISNNFIDGRIYNIGSSQYHDIETLADIIWKYTGADKSLIEYKDCEVLTTKVKKVDNSLAVRELGHEETVSLEDGVKKTIDWMRDYYRL